MNTSEQKRAEADAQLRRFVVYTVVAVVFTALLFIPSRYLKYNPEYSLFASRLVALMAVFIILSPLIYVARMLRQPRAIRIGAVVAIFFILLRTLMEVLESIDWLDSWPMLGRFSNFEDLLSVLSSWIGATFLLGTLYISIFELVRARKQSDRVCEDLAAEVAQRKAIAEELARRSETERVFSERLSALHLVHLRLSGARSIDELSQLALELARERLGFSALCLWLRASDKECLQGCCCITAEGALLDKRTQNRPIKDLPESWREVLAGNTAPAVRTLDDAPTVELLAELRDGEESLGIVSAHILAQGALEVDAMQQILTLFAGILANLCRRQRADAEREWLLSALEQSAESVMITDTEGVIEYVNPAFERVSGYAQAEVLGQNARMLKSGQHDAAFFQQFWTTISGGNIWQGRFLNRRKDGTAYTEDVTVSPVRDGQGRILHYVAVKNDVTTQLALEQQHQQSQKMESIGRLAGGVAHDFNNMLAVILGQTEFALEQLDESQPLYYDLKEIQKAAQRSAEMTRQLLAFARKQLMVPKVLDLNQIVADSLSLLRRLIGEDIALTWQPGPALWLVKMDPSQVHQVLTNLCINARDAIAGVGTVQLETRNIEVGESYCKRHPQAAPGEYVLLTVKDSGCGMESETLEHLFEPFYTTKKVGEGTGLGLAMVYGVVSQNKGFITVSSQTGLGTTFKLYLPRHREAAPEPCKRIEQEAVAPTRETVLLVEDEPSLLTICSSMLKRLGYNALPAETPGEALRIAREHPGEIHVLLSDVIMPEMNGRDLADKVLEIHPRLLRVFMSGYTAEVIAQHGVIEEGLPFLQKPFSMEELAATLQWSIAAAGREDSA